MDMKPLLGLALGAACCLATAVQADTQHSISDRSYVTVSAGKSDIDTSGFDDADYAGLGAGWQFSKNWALEAAYSGFQNAQDKGTDVILGNYDLEFEGTGVTMAFLGTFPITDNFQLYAKAGLLFWDADFNVKTSLLGSGTQSYNGEDVVWGGGAELLLTSSVSMTADFQRWRLKDGDLKGDVDTWSLGLRYSF